MTKKANELRKEIDKLEKHVGEAVHKFIQEHGNCDIKIDVENKFIDISFTKQFVRTDVKVYVTI